MIGEIERLGGNAILAPMIDIAEPDSWGDVDASINAIETFDAVIFASANAAERFLVRCGALRVDMARMGHLRVYAVGAKTRTIAERAGLHVGIIPESFSSAGLSKVLEDEAVSGKRILFPSGDKAGRELELLLEGRGATTRHVVVYRTVRPVSSDNAKLRDDVVGGRIDVLTFASPSAVVHFAELFSAEERQGIRSRCVIGVIGPTTQRAALEAGLEAAVVAAESTGTGLIRALSEFCSPTP